MNSSIDGDINITRQNKNKSENDEKQKEKDKQTVIVFLTNLIDGYILKRTTYRGGFNQFLDTKIDDSRNSDIYKIIKKMYDTININEKINIDNASSAEKIPLKNYISESDYKTYLDYITSKKKSREIQNQPEARGEASRSISARKARPGPSNVESNTPVEKTKVEAVSRPISAKRRVSGPQNVESNTAVANTKVEAASRPIATSPAEKSKSKTQIPTTTPSSTEELQPPQLPTPQSQLLPPLPPSNESLQASQIATTEESSDELSKTEEGIIILDALPETIQNAPNGFHKITIKKKIQDMISYIDSNISDDIFKKYLKYYLLIKIAQKQENYLIGSKIKIDKIKSIIEKERDIETKLKTLMSTNIFDELKQKIKTFVQNPSISSGGLTESINTIQKKILSRPSRPLSASQSSPSLQDCTTLGLMPELVGDMRPAALLNMVPPMCTFFLSNKRYCYHIIRRNDIDEYLKQLINYFYFDKDLSHTPPALPKKIIPTSNKFDKIDDFPGINDIFDYNKKTPIKVAEVKTYDTTNSKKNLLFTIITSNIKPVVPRILSTHYVLVSYMNSDTTTTIHMSEDYENITINNPDSRNRTVLLNYQYMQFPPLIKIGATNTVTTRIGPPNVQEKQSISSRRQPTRSPDKGGNKTIRKYRKHNRNKTTRNYN